MHSNSNSHEKVTEHNEYLQGNTDVIVQKDEFTKQMSERSTKENDKKVHSPVISNFSRTDQLLEKIEENAIEERISFAAVRIITRYIFIRS